MQGTDLLLNPGADELSYAIYEVGLAPWEFSTVDYDIEFEDAAKTWLALADYSTMNWDFVQASPSSTSLAAAASKLYSPAGGAYFAVFAFDATTVRIKSVSVQLDVPNWHSYTFELNSPDESFDFKLIGDRLYLLYVDGVDDLCLAWADVDEPEAPVHWIRKTLPYLGMDIDSLRLAEVQGKPAVAFYLVSLDAVAYYQAQVLTPESVGDWQMWTLDTTIDADLALAEIDGMPALAYFTEDPPGYMWLNFTYPDNPDPVSLEDWNSTKAMPCPPSSANGQDYLALCDMAGAASIAYFDEDTMEYYYMRADNNAPMSMLDWTLCRVGTSSFRAVGPWIGQHSQGPLAVYRDIDAGSFVLALANQFSPIFENQWTKHSFASEISNSDYFSCCLVGSGLGVAFVDEVDMGGPGLKEWHLFYYWFDADPPVNSFGWKSQDLLDPDFGGFDDGDDLWSCTRPVVASSAGGRPHIAYYDYSAGPSGNDDAIKIAHLAPTQ